MATNDHSRMISYEVHQAGASLKILWSILKRSYKLFVILPPVLNKNRFYLMLILMFLDIFIETHKL